MVNASAKSIDFGFAFQISFPSGQFFEIFPHDGGSVFKVIREEFLAVIRVIRVDVELGFAIQIFFEFAKASDVRVITLPFVIHNGGAFGFDEAVILHHRRIGVIRIDVMVVIRFIKPSGDMIRIMAPGFKRIRVHRVFFVIERFGVIRVKGGDHDGDVWVAL